ncbi:hypothetical protein CAEBREN_00763 [Caenorhabditis brenneri]|uniref:SPK domain-containing protein n=1 Tax=Caenorhabditis brenneri TaxID=135651 RepID=G0NY38_CAEBE|nr:hypothetical protein CAEBREN_00763 [Caenorhabditis brenneri]
MSSQALIKPSAWLSGESLNLMSFIAKKSKTAQTPLRITKLCEEFIEEYGSQSLRSTLDQRLRVSLRSRIPEIEGLDTETKARMMFLLSGTVDSVFLKELQTAGVVELDERSRITRFQKHNGEVVCSGKHLDHGAERDVGKDDEIIEFLSKISDQNPQPISLAEFARRYKADTKCPLSETTIAARLRKYATVEVDEDKRITAYKANNHSLELKGKPQRRSGVSSSGTSRARSPVSASGDSTRPSSRSARSATKAPIRTCLYKTPEPVPRKQPRVVPPTFRLAGFTKDPDSGSTSPPPDEQSSASSWHSMEVEYGNPTGTSRETQLKLEPVNAQIKKEYISPPRRNRMSIIENEMKVPEERVSRMSVQGSQRSTTTTSSRMIPSSNEEASSKVYLLMLRSIVRSLDSFILAEVNGQIEQAIETVGEKKVLITDLLAVLKSGLLVFKKSAKTEEITEDSTSLKEFLLILRSGLFTQRTAILDDFQMELKEVIDELQAKDKALSIQCIRSVLETLLLIINA